MLSKLLSWVVNRYVAFTVALPATQGWACLGVATNHDALHGKPAKNPDRRARALQTLTIWVLDAEHWSARPALTHHRMERPGLS